MITLVILTIVILTTILINIIPITTHTHLNYNKKRPAHLAVSFSLARDPEELASLII